MDGNLTNLSMKVPSAVRPSEPANANGAVRLLAGSSGSWEPPAAAEANCLAIHQLRTRLAEVESQLREARKEVRRLRCQCGQARVELQPEAIPLEGHSGLIGCSAALRRTLVQARQVAVTSSTVLLLGETGTGKELIASAIHEFSPRRQRPMVRVNCAAIPATLIESELFGRERGAYTGAFARQIGSFELAHGSTLFLDEVGELSLEIQAKLLRVLQELKIQRLGSPSTVKVDVRVLAASNRDLARLAGEGKFRPDLYYRLNVFPIKVPPLRERREDIPILATAFINEFAKAMGKDLQSIAPSSLRTLEAYAWPGNVRELRNVIERAVILAQGPQLHIELPTVSSRVVAPARSLSLSAVEREHIRSVLEMTGWRVRGKEGAAALLGLEPSTLRSRMVKLGLRRPQRPGELS